MLVNDSHGRLWLWRKVYTLRYYGASVCQDVSLVLIHILLTFLRRIKEKIKFRILITEIQLQHFFAVVCLFSIRALYSQCIIQFILNIGRIVIRVCIFLIKDLLHVGIQGCHNLQTTAVKKIGSLCLGISFNVHQVADDLIGNLVFKVCVNGAFFFCIFHLCSLNTGINIIVQCFVIFIL